VATIVAFTGFEYGTAVGVGTGNPGPFDGITGVVGTDLQVVAGTPVVGSYVGQVTTLNNKNYFWNTTTLGTGKTEIVASFRFMFTTLPTSANDFHAIDVAASTDRAGFYYDPADQKVHAWITSATQAASSTIVANTWYTMSFRFSCIANPNTLDWTFNGVAQTSVSNALGASTISRYALGNRGGTNGVVNFDDLAVSVTSADYPLPIYQVRMVGVDTGGTTTEIGTANATVRFTANGTLDGTHNSANILAALTEVPPLLGATSSGVAQQTAGAGNAVEIPMTTYTLTGGETIAGCRIYLAGWAASALAANLGLRAWNGTAETTLHGDTAAGFDNTSNGAWYAFMYGGVTDQTTLNALTVRMGYSTDVSPVIGAHAIYAEILIVPGAGSTSLADVAGGGSGAGSTTETITTVLKDLAGGGAASGATGPETSTAAIPDLAGGGAGAGSKGPETISTILNDAAGGGAVSGETGPELAGSVLGDLAGGGAASGANTETISTVLTDAAGGGAGAGSTTEATTVGAADTAGGGSGAGGVPPEGVTVALSDTAGGGAGAGSTGSTISTVLSDLAGGGAASGTSVEVGATVLGDVAGGGAASGTSGPETQTSGGGSPVTLADVPGGGAVTGATIETPASGTVVHDTMVYPVLTAALSCLQGLATIWPNAPALFQLRSGNSFTASADSTMDECCAGIAWVRLGTGYPTDNFPIQKVEVGDGTETDWAYQIEFGVQRCIPTQGDDGMYGSVVTSAQWLAVVQQEADDAAMLRKALCCLRDTYHYVNGLPMGNQGIIFGIQTPLENSGPCGGTMQIATVRIPACDCVDN
jgi:hypothetical protein